MVSPFLCPDTLVAQRKSPALRRRRLQVRVLPSVPISMQGCSRWERRAVSKTAVIESSILSSSATPFRLLMNGGSPFGRGGATLLLRQQISVHLTSSILSVPVVRRRESRCRSIGVATPAARTPRDCSPSGLQRFRPWAALPMHAPYLRVRLGIGAYPTIRNRYNQMHADLLPE